MIFARSLSLRVTSLGASLCVWVAGSIALSSCSNHLVSPFLQVDPAQLLRPDDDLDAALDRARSQATSDALKEDLRVDGVLRDGRPFVALGFSGVDAIGRSLFAVRVVTPSGIVLALGPDRALPRDPSVPSRLLPSWLGAYPSGQDLTGDSMPDVLVSADDGTLAVYRVDRLGTLRYPVISDVPPSRIVDVNTDGWLDLLGTVPVPAGDPIAPELSEVAVCTGGGFSARHPATIAWHREREKAIVIPSDGTPERRLKAAIEKAFHAMRAGERPADAFAPAAALATSLAPMSAPTVVSWVRWRGWLADHALSLAPPGDAATPTPSR
jgi:hypothetical protein